MALAVPALAETLYVQPNGGSYGTHNGSSWANAFNGFGDVVWGGGTGQVGPGDTLYVGAGSYSVGFSAGASGLQGNAIIIRAAQDTYSGVAVLSSVNMNGRTFINMDGSFNGATNFVFANGINGQYAHYCKWSHFTMTNSVVDLRWAGTNEVSYYRAVLTSGTSQETTLYGIASANVGRFQTVPNAYDQTIIHHGHVLVPGQINNGNGPDGVHSGTGFTFSNMVFQAFAGSYNGSQHQDLIQCYGDSWIKVVGCEFIDSGDSQLDLSKSGIVSFSHMRVFNNVFRRTINGMGTVMVRLYTVGGTIGNYTDVHIDNNTFIDGSRTTASYGAAIRLQSGSGNTTSSDSSIANNIIFNCGRGWAALLVEAVAPNWNFSYNVINAGSTGNANTSGWTQSNGQTGVPRFFSYQPFGLNNDYHLASSDTVAIDRGMNLSRYITGDRDGLARPQQAAWDIGAYEFGTATPSTNPVVVLEPGNLDFGSIEAGTTLDRSLIVRNVGGGVLAGNVIAANPFSVVSGGAFSLAANQAQTVVLRYAPSAAAIHSGYATVTGGGGAIIALNGSAWAALPGLSFGASAGVLTFPFTTNSGGYVSQAIQTGSEGGRATYAFSITTAGQYTVSVEVNAPSQAEDSFFVNIDDEPTDPTTIWDIIPLTAGFEGRLVTWRGTGTYDAAEFAPKIFTLSTGTHRLIIAGREAGAQLRQIVISPVGIARPSAPSDLRAVEVF